MSTERPDPRSPGGVGAPPSADHGPGAGTSVPPDGGTGRSVGQSVGTGARATARGLRGFARVTGRFGKATWTQARRAAGAQGADRSGLNRLIELHACNAAGDAAVAIALAGTIFFAGATSDARGQVALFLGLTMLPFAIVAPLIGPFLDRFSHGRRWAIGATFAIRGFLCWVLAGAVASESVWFYPAALGVLVSSKAYGVTRAAAVPRLVPTGITLVKANGRVSLAGVVGASVSAPLAGAAAYFGPEWALRVGFLVFALGTVAAILLPAKVDSTEGEQEVGTDDPRTGRRRGTGIPPAVSFALRVNCGPRWLSGFLTMFMAFLLREEPIPGWEDRTTLLIGLVIGAAGLGNTLGIVLASVAKKINPAVTVVAALLADIALVVVAAVFYSLVPLVALGLTAGLAQYLAKVSLDTTIQTGVPARAHASAFARGDTTLQLAWVVGGFVGIAMPLEPLLGLVVAAIVLSAWAVFVLGTRSRRAGAPRPAASATTRL
ncbi:MFS transporter [Nocardioides sp. TF02-7]|uniref:MFS transporter n=1 Tax=Nocardioides sp. TF02-7 TaxID=2917724 RepID=UPI001F061918|nr:MFS transporter [Nocardioides sp. TF02-7]UMG91368.1 MFS transporter [Nocardioides sp. TF02-7]